MKHTMYYWLCVFMLLTSMESFSKNFENNSVQNQQEQSAHIQESPSIPLLLGEAYRIMRQNNRQADENIPHHSQQQLSAVYLRFIQYHSPFHTSEGLESSDSDTD